MKLTLRSAALAAALVFGVDTGQAASFTYHGSLQDSGKPAEGSYDIELTLYSAPSGGSVIGGPLVMYKVPVHGGSFNTEADFGPLTQSFNQAFVSVRVRNAGRGEYAALNARAPMSVVATTSVCPGAWTLQGNANAIGGSSTSFLGTTDANDPLIFEVGGVQVGQLTSSGDASYPSSPNVVLGAPGNSVLATIGGATIAGGGDVTLGFNSVQADFATIGGGADNTASGFGSTVAGGEVNTAGQTDSTVAGGRLNMATGGGSAVAGGNNNAASGTDATVAGGQANTAGGDNSLAAGDQAVVRGGDHGTFAWADDSSVNPFTSTGPDQFLIQSVGGVGINTNAPFSHTLTVAGSSGPISPFTPTASSAAVFENNSIAFVELATPAANENGVLFSLVGHSADGGIVYNDSGGGYSRGLELRTGGNVTRLAITSAGETLNTSGAWTKFSDIRLKRDIAPIDDPLDTFLGLHGQTFEYIDPVESMAMSGRQMGFIAQDVEQVLPQWISQDARGYKMVTTSGFEALTVEAIRALRDEKDGQVDALLQENAALRTSLNEVLARVSKLESKQGE